MAAGWESQSASKGNAVKRFSGLIAKTKQAAIAVLMSSGIQAEERWWDEAEFSIHRLQSGRIEQTKFILHAIPNATLNFHESSFAF